MSEHLGLARRLWVCGIMVYLLVLPIASRAGQAPSLAIPRPIPPPPKRPANSAAWNASSPSSRKTPAAAPRSTASTAIHVERGILDTFIKSYRDRVANNPDDGTGWLILGLLEGQRGQDAAAVAALRQAETTRPDDPLPPYYLGQALVLVGQPEQAAAALERALERKPARNDLLEIFQALGRVYQRTQKTDQALQVWNRLEALFPNDPRVQDRSPRPWPRKISPPPPCPASRRSPRKPPTPSARSSSPCRLPT